MSKYYGSLIWHLARNWFPNTLFCFILIVLRMASLREAMRQEIVSELPRRFYHFLIYFIPFPFLSFSFLSLRCSCFCFFFVPSCWLTLHCVFL